MIPRCCGNLQALHKREEEGGDEDEYDAASDEAEDVASDS